MIDLSKPRRPRQAVILAGGLGSRLGSITSTKPKPMVPVLGRPFLAYQLEQLKAQGFERVLLLLGYLPEVVKEYFGNGEEWGIEVDYSVTPVHYETALRLRAAASQLEPTFLLLYCDNYWPMQMDRMWP